VSGNSDAEVGPVLPVDQVVTTFPPFFCPVGYLVVPIAVRCQQVLSQFVLVGTYIGVDIRYKFCLDFSSHRRIGFKGEGIKGLIELPSILSNILSYARLFAVGLASVQLALIINKFATDTFLPKLEKAAQDQDIGFDKNQAHILSAMTTAGSLAMLAVPGNSAETLWIKVVSPNGTTEAGLKKLQNNPDNLSEAVKAAKKRAEELSKS